MLLLNFHPIRQTIHRWYISQSYYEACNHVTEQLISEWYLEAFYKKLSFAKNHYLCRLKTIL